MHQHLGRAGHILDFGGVCLGPLGGRRLEESSGPRAFVLIFDQAGSGALALPRDDVPQGIVLRLGPHNVAVAALAVVLFLLLPKKRRP